MLAFFLTLAFLTGYKKKFAGSHENLNWGHNDAINWISTVKGVKHNIRKKLTYFNLSSSNPNEVSHFILKNLILKSNNNLTFFLKNLRKTISSRMMISYQIVRVVPSLVASLELLAHHRNVASLRLFYSYYFGKC